VCDNFCYDIQVRYALGYRQLGEGDFDLRTLYYFREQLSRHMQETGVNLLDKASEQVTDAQIAAYQVKTGKQRMDSFQIASNLRQMERVQLLVEALQRVQHMLNETDQQHYAEDFAPILKGHAGHYVHRLKGEAVDPHLQLTGGSRTALPRHQTLQATIDWSHRLLSPEESCLLHRLSVFAGGCTLEAAEAICAGDCLEQAQVLELLGTLVNKSMLIADRCQGQEPRYRLYETVRQYAQKKLYEAGESQSLRDRHLDYFLHLAETAEIKLHSVEQPIWIRRVKAELDNLLAAMAWAYQGSGRQERGLRIAISLPWHLQGNEGEGKRWIEAGLELLENHPEAELLLARAKSELGWLLNYLGDFQRSQLVIEQCIALCRNLGESAGAFLSHALNGLAYREMHSGDITSALTHYDESIEVARSLGPPGFYQFSEALMMKAWFYDFWLDMYDQGYQIAEEFMTFAYQNQFSESLIKAGLWGKGFISTQRGDYERAHAALEEALSFYTGTGEKEAASVTNFLRGWLSYRQGNCRMAYQHELKLLKYWYEVGNRRESLLALPLLGTYKVSQSLQLNPAENAQTLEQAATIFGAYEKLNEQTHYKHETFIENALVQAIEILRSELNPSVFSRFWARGQAMTLDEAVAFAFSLAEVEPFPSR